VARVWRHHEANDGARLRVFTYVALAVMSHGLLDTMTTYGEGVALFAPLAAHRFDAPWHPFTGVVEEAVGLWVPAAIIGAVSLRPKPSAG
jgi:membrane-bound metal-dependent hydrolase YbcI (DUF457 family)